MSAFEWARLEPSDVSAVASLEGVHASELLNETRLHEELARPWAHLWVARAGLQPAAFLLVWHVVDELHILNIATGSPWRRKGASRGLLNLGLAFAREKSVRLVLLEVRPSNAPALALYRGLGFEELRTRRAYYNDGEDALEMSLTM